MPVGATFGVLLARQTGGPVARPAPRRPLADHGPGLARPHRHRHARDPLADDAARQDGRACGKACAASASGAARESRHRRGCLPRRRAGAHRDCTAGVCRRPRLVGRALLAPARRSAPRRFATVSAAAALLWLIATVVGVAVLVLVAPDWAGVGEQYDRVGAALAVGVRAPARPGRPQPPRAERPRRRPLGRARRARVVRARRALPRRGPQRRRPDVVAASTRGHPLRGCRRSMRGVTSFLPWSASRCASPYGPAEPPRPLPLPLRREFRCRRSRSGPRTRSRPRSP